MLERVLQEIRTRRRIIVTSHARPDGDGIGSALACSQILRVMGKDADVVLLNADLSVDTVIARGRPMIQAGATGRARSAWRAIAFTASTSPWIR